MKKLWDLIGHIAYFFARPIIAKLLRNTRRTRLLLVHEDKLLIVKGWLGDGSWMLPGGGLHKHEAPNDGVLREVREEVGISLDASHLSLAGKFVCDEKGFNFKYYLFVCRATELYELRPQLLEISEARWIGRDDLANYKLGSEVIQSLDSWPL